MIVKIGTEYYDLLHRDSGFPHPEDRGLWRAVKVKLNESGHWYCCDDDDYMITDEMQIIAIEVGWRLERIKV